MNRILQLAGLLGCLLLLNPIKGNTQTQLDPCPFTGIYISDYNSHKYVALPLGNGSVFGWVDGTYLLMLGGNGMETPIINELPWTKVNDISIYLPGVPNLSGVQGIVIDITGESNIPTTTQVQMQGTYLFGSRSTPYTNFLSLTFDTNPSQAQECIWDILPVTFLSVNAALNGSNQAVISWTTDHEDDINHFSIYKKNAYNDWKKIGEVPPGPGPTGSYSWIDTFQTYNPTYRVVEVSNKCVKTLSAERSITRTGSQNFPTIAPDCGPYVSGADTLCGTTQRFYTLKNVRGQQNITWTVSPANLGTVKGYGLSATFTPSSTVTGNGTLTATINLAGGATEVYTKTIRVGNSTDCTPSIVGPDAACGTGTQTFKLRNLRPGAQTVNWTVSPSWRGSITATGQQVTFTPGLAVNAGVATITASLTQNGTTSTYTKLVTVGVPDLQVSYYDTQMGCYSYLHQVTLTPLPGTGGSEYQWYQNGGYLGSGTYWQFYVIAPTSQYYSIEYMGPCGISYYNGYAYAPVMSYSSATPYTVSPNPARGGIISLMMDPYPDPPCPVDPLMADPTAKTTTSPNTRTVTPAGPVTRSTVSKSVEIKIFDITGRLRKTVKTQSSGSRLNIHAPELPNGIYFLQVSEPGKQPVKLKVFIEK